MKRPRLLLKTIFHIAILVYNVFVTTWGMNNIISREFDEEIMKHNQVEILRTYFAVFLTDWNYLFQTIFLILAVIHDLLEWSNKHKEKIGKTISYRRDIIYSALVAPITIYVVVMFWIFYWIDRELIYSSCMDKVVPSWFNHSVHTYIVLVVIIEHILEPRRRPINFKEETLTYVTVIGIYTALYYTTTFIDGRWIYNFYYSMNWWQKCLFQLHMWLSIYVIYLLQYPVNRFIHGDERKSAKVEEKTEKVNGTHAVNGINEFNAINKVNGVNGVNGIGKEMAEAKTKVTIKNGDLNYQSQFKEAPFVDTSWSLKYRAVRNLFEDGKI